MKQLIENYNSERTTYEILMVKSELLIEQLQKAALLIITAMRASTFNQKQKKE